METYRIRYIDGPELGAALELVREFTGVGLRAAKEIVETRGVILDDVSAAEARRLREHFAAIGAEVEVEQTWRYVYAFDPDDPARGDQTIARVRAGPRELGLDVGNLGAMYAVRDPWTTNVTAHAREGGLLTRNDHPPSSVQRFAEDAARDRRLDAQLERWRAEGRALAASEIEVLEAVSARDPALEARLREDPGDAANHLIYGDWLQSRGDPRGALVTLQRAVSEADPGDHRASRELRARELEYRKRHLSHLFGPLRRVADEVVETWSLGFIDAAFVGAGRHRANTSPLSTLRDLLRLPIAARLRKLGLTTRLLRREAVEAILCESEVVAWLRELELGDQIRADGPSPLVFRWLWSHLPRLRKLTLRSDRPPLRSLHSASLEHLELYMLGLPNTAIVTEITTDGPGPGDSHPHHFVAGRLPRLRTLSLGFETTQDMSPAAFAALLSLPEFDGVSALNLRLPRHQAMPVGVAEILASIPRLSALEVLDLSGCSVDARGMAAIEHARGRGYLPEDTRLPARV